MEIKSTHILVFTINVSIVKYLFFFPHSLLQKSLINSWHYLKAYNISKNLWDAFNIEKKEKGRILEKQIQNSPPNHVLESETGPLFDDADNI